MKTEEIDEDDIGNKMTVMSNEYVITDVYVDENGHKNIVRSLVDENERTEVSE